jgi:hypothetical protein
LPHSSAASFACSEGGLWTARVGRELGLEARFPVGDFDLVEPDLVEFDLVGFDLVGFDRVDFELVDFDLFDFDLFDFGFDLVAAMIVGWCEGGCPEGYAFFAASPAVSLTCLTLVATLLTRWPMWSARSAASLTLPAIFCVSRRIPCRFGISESGLKPLRFGSETPRTFGRRRAR